MEAKENRVWALDPQRYSNWEVSPEKQVCKVKLPPRKTKLVNKNAQSFDIGLDAKILS